MCGCGCGSSLVMCAGQNGRGIVSITDNGGGVYTVLYTDGTTQPLTAPQGEEGPIGPQGIPGISGLTVNWDFDTDTNPSPASGFLRYNFATADLCTKIYINHTDANSIARNIFLDSFSNDTVTGSGNIYKYGIIRIFDPSNLNTYASFKILSLTDQTTYREIDVEFLQRDGNFADNTEVSVTFIPSENILDEKVIELNGWNMDANQFFSVNHGITDYTKITEVQVMIKPDATAILVPLNTWATTGFPQGGVIQLDTDDILLGRLASGTFDAADYSGGGLRGYMTIKYLK